MTPAPIPADEATRLAALHAMKILDTAPEERFDRVTRLACRLFDVPIALVSLVDRDRQWFKSAQGVAIAETPRRVSFCGHAILGDEPMVIADARQDPRFADNPLVTGEVAVRFYAGQPIHAGDGSRIGTLCVLDRRPREFGSDDRRALADLAAWVESELNGVEQGVALALGRENEGRLRAVIDGLHDGILTVNARGTVDSYSAGAARIFGFPADAVMGLDLPTVLGLLCSNPLPYSVATAPAAGDAVPTDLHGEVLGRRIDGSEFAMEISVRNVSAGRRVVLARDVSQRKRAEAALRESEARLRSLAEEQGMLLAHTRDFVYRHDTAGVFNYLSPAVESVTGRTPEEWMRHYSSYMTDHPVNANVYAYTEETLRSGRQSPPYLVEVFHKDGRRIMLEVNERAYYEGERIAGIVGVARDVTERERIEHMKGEFISTVSHELRTPLTSIVGALGLVAGGVTGELPPPVRGLIDIARKNGERLVRLINDILDLEKIKSGTLDIRLRPIEVTPLVEQAIEINRPFAERFRVRFELVPGATGAVIRSDGDRVLQVLTNLLSNAAKFSPAESTVQVSVERRADQVRISVHDPGPGIPESFRPRIFQKFAQADTSDAGRRGGTGLGLNISRAIVDLLGGTIDYESPSGEGTTFTVAFPEWRG